MYEVTGDHRLKLTEPAWAAMRNINDAGNKVVWTPDLTVWGAIDRWEFPKDLGQYKVEDCDGIALYKMDLLLKAGFPSAPLLFTVCIDENSGGHAVLCVATDRGDFILDNRFEDVKTYDDLKNIGYRFLYRSAIGGKLNGLWDKIAEHR